MRGLLVGSRTSRRLYDPFATGGPLNRADTGQRWRGVWTERTCNDHDPTAGGEQVVNGSFGADTDWDKGTGWSIGSGVGSIDGSNPALSNLYNSGGSASVIGTWYQGAFDVTARSAGSIRFYVTGIEDSGFKAANGTYVFTARATNADKVGFQAGAGAILSVDNGSRKALTLATLFGNAVDLTTPDCAASLYISALTTGTQTGLALRLDDAATPANYLLVYHDGSNVKVDQVISSTATNLKSVSNTWAAGILVCLLVGTELHVWYGGTYITTATVTASRYTKAATFNTYASNVFSSFLTAVGDTLTPTTADHDPTLGGELVPNGAMEGGANPPASWVAFGSPTSLTSDNTDAYAGTYSCKVISGGTEVGFMSASDNVNLTAGVWTTLTFAYKVDSGSIYFYCGSSGVPTILSLAATSWTVTTRVFRATATGGVAYIFRSQTGTPTFRVDAVSTKNNTLSTLFGNLTTVQAATKWTLDLDSLTSNTQLGLVLRLDSAASPANFIIVYHNGATILADKCVAGTYTNLLSVANTFAANTLTVEQVGTTYYVWYGSTYIGTFAVTDAGIRDNSIHGTFNTYSANTFSDLTIQQRVSSVNTGGLNTGMPWIGTTVVTNGGFDSDTSGWTATQSTLASVAGGETGNCLQVTNVGANNGYGYQALATAVGRWYQLVLSQKNGTSTGQFRLGTTIGGNELFFVDTNNANWATYTRTFRSTAATLYLRLGNYINTDALTSLWDTVRMVALRLSDLLDLTDLGCRVGTLTLTDVRVTSGTQIGAAANWDSPSNPNNGVIAYTDGTNILIDKCVDGTWTNLQTTASAWTNDDDLELRIRATDTGLGYSVYKNGVPIGAEQTVTDAGIISNTYHGKFNTYRNTVGEISFTIRRAG